MPTLKHEVVSQGKVIYTCFDTDSLSFYSFALDLKGIEYVIKTTRLY